MIHDSYNQGYEDALNESAELMDRFEEIYADVGPMNKFHVTSILKDCILKKKHYE